MFRNQKVKCKTPLELNIPMHKSYECVPYVTVPQPTELVLTPCTLLIIVVMVSTVTLQYRLIQVKEIILYYDPMWLLFETKPIISIII